MKYKKELKFIYENKEEQEYRHLSWEACRYICLDEEMYQNPEIRAIYNYILEYWAFFKNIVFDIKGFTPSKLEVVLKAEARNKKYENKITKKDVELFIKDFGIKRELLSFDLRIITKPSFKLN